MKVIFLDIDGVLCTNNYWKTHRFIMKGLGIDPRSAMAHITYRDEFGHIFDPVAVENLKKTIAATNAKIVLSSTWRLSGLQTMQTMWRMRNLPGKVIDITPNLYKHRGEEIAEWLQNNQVDNYVIIDDNTDMLPEQKPYFVQTDSNYGLTFIDAVRCTEILNSPHAFLNP